MSRFDKYEPIGGGFRAALAAATTTAQTGDVLGVTLDGSGRVVVGGAVADYVGVICPTKVMAAGDVVDVMTDGEIVEFTLNDGTAAAAGTKYYADLTTGDLSTTGTGSYVGTTVEAGRLVVRVAR